MNGINSDSLRAKFGEILQEAVPLKSGDQVEVNFWRRSSLKNVWYEWCISKPVPGPIHNPNGRSYTIGL